MQTFTLQFQTPQDLAGFPKTIKGRVEQVHIAHLTITCACSQADIALAMNYYAGKVIEAKK